MYVFISLQFCASVPQWTSSQIWRFDYLQICSKGLQEYPMLPAEQTHQYSNIKPNTSIQYFLLKMYVHCTSHSRKRRMQWLGPQTCNPEVPSSSKLLWPLSGVVSWQPQVQLLGHACTCKYPAGSLAGLLSVGILTSSSNSNLANSNSPLTWTKSYFPCIWPHFFQSFICTISYVYLKLI